MPEMNASLGEIATKFAWIAAWNFQVFRRWFQDHRVAAAFHSNDQADGKSSSRGSETRFTIFLWAWASPFFLDS
jgi:hypothetical protein